MKNDKLYPLYLNYLNDKLDNGKLTKGAYSLMKISRSCFDDFKSKMGDKLFEGEQIKSNRDKKIDDIFDEFDFD
jgi:hypothetical protein